MAMPPLVMEEMMADVSMATAVAFSAAHSSPFAKVPVCTIAIEPGAGVVSTLPSVSSPAAKREQEPPLPSVAGSKRAFWQASDTP